MSHNQGQQYQTINPNNQNRGHHYPQETVPTGSEHPSQREYQYSQSQPLAPSLEHSRPPHSQTGTTPTLSNTTGGIQQEELFLQELDDYNDKRYGKTTIYEDPTQGAYFTLKTIPLRSSNQASKLVSLINRRINSPNLYFVSPLTYEYSSDPSPSLGLYMPFPEEDLDKELRMRRQAGTQLSNKEITFLMYDIMSGLHHLYSIGLYHRTLSPMFVARTTTGYALLDDPLLSSRQVTDLRRFFNKQTGRLDRCYYSPELFQICVSGERPGKRFEYSKSDVFSFGLVMLQAAIGVEDLSELYPASQAQEQHPGFNVSALDHFLYIFRCRYAENNLLTSTVSKMLEIDPELRPDIKEIFSKLPEYDLVKDYFGENPEMSENQRASMRDSLQANTLRGASSVQTGAVGGSVGRSPQGGRGSIAGAQVSQTSGDQVSGGRVLGRKSGQEAEIGFEDQPEVVTAKTIQKQLRFEHETQNQLAKASRQSLQQQSGSRLSQMNNGGPKHKKSQNFSINDNEGIVQGSDRQHRNYPPKSPSGGSQYHSHQQPQSQRLQQTDYRTSYTSGSNYDSNPQNYASNPQNYSSGQKYFDPGSQHYSSGTEVYTSQPHNQRALYELESPGTIIEDIREHEETINSRRSIVVKKKKSNRDIIEQKFNSWRRKQQLEQYSQNTQNYSQEEPPLPNKVLPPPPPYGRYEGYGGYPERPLEPKVSSPNRAKIFEDSEPDHEGPRGPHQSRSREKNQVGGNQQLANQGHHRQDYTPSKPNQQPPGYPEGIFEGDVNQNFNKKKKNQRKSVSNKVEQTVESTQNRGTSTADSRPRNEVLNGEIEPHNEGGNNRKVGRDKTNAWVRNQQRSTPVRNRGQQTVRIDGNSTHPQVNQQQAGGTRDDDSASKVRKVSVSGYPKHKTFENEGRDVGGNGQGYQSQNPVGARNQQYLSGGTPNSKSGQYFANKNSSNSKYPSTSPIQILVDQSVLKTEIPEGWVQQGDVVVTPSGMRVQRVMEIGRKSSRSGRLIEYKEMKWRQVSPENAPKSHKHTPNIRKSPHHHTIITNTTFKPIRSSTLLKKGQQATHQPRYPTTTITPSKTTSAHPLITNHTQLPQSTKRGTSGENIQSLYYRQQKIEPSQAESKVLIMDSASAHRPAAEGSRVRQTTNYKRNRSMSRSRVDSRFITPETRKVLYGATTPTSGLYSPYGGARKAMGVPRNEITINSRSITPDKSGVQQSSGRGASNGYSSGRGYQPQKVVIGAEQGYSRMPGRGLGYHHSTQAPQNQQEVRSISPKGGVGLRCHPIHIQTGVAPLVLNQHYNKENLIPYAGGGSNTRNRAPAAGVVKRSPVKVPGPPRNQKKVSPKAANLAVYQKMMLADPTLPLPGMHRIQGGGGRVATAITKSSTPRGQVILAEDRSNNSRSRSNTKSRRMSTGSRVLGDKTKGSRVRSSRMDPSLVHEDPYSSNIDYYGNLRLPGQQEANNREGGAQGGYGNRGSSVVGTNNQMVTFQEIKNSTKLRGSKVNKSNSKTRTRSINGGAGRGLTPPESSNFFMNTNSKMRHVPHNPPNSGNMTNFDISSTNYSLGINPNSHQFGAGRGGGNNGQMMPNILDSEFSRRKHRARRLNQGYMQ